MKQQVLENILNKKIVAILRGLEYEQNFRVMETLIEAGITNFEVTLNTPKALAVIEEGLKKYGKSAFIGAGTVKDKQDTLNAIGAGAQFLIAPNLSEESIEAAIEKDVLIAPGVFSPTEMVKASALGCDIVKLFPAVVLGAGYIHQIKGPLNTIKIMAVGGIDSSNVGEYMKAGVNAFGLGSCLVKSELINEGRYDLLKAHFEKYVDLIN
ncbi:MAG: hypothetical protein K0R69_2644 [Clostridia bacterium]|jgi:2-dehydro-3-deoxyphosphogluconate aldolase/(4S)-4-hydroxy-2-oxoglutarate aldolase|nr:hypothetical protein [Clostridia bacterium]